MTFTPRNPDWEARTRAGHAAQGMMRTMGLKIAHIAPGEVHEDIERALAQLEEMLGTVVERRSIRPGFQRGNRVHRHQDQKRGNNGVHRSQVRIVPGRNNKYHAHGLALDVATETLFWLHLQGRKRLFCDVDHVGGPFHETTYFRQILPVRLPIRDIGSKDRDTIRQAQKNQPIRNSARSVFDQRMRHRDQTQPIRSLTLYKGFAAPYQQAFGIRVRHQASQRVGIAPNMCRTVQP